MTPSDALPQVTDVFYNTPLLMFVVLNISTESDSRPD